MHDRTQQRHHRHHQHRQHPQSCRLLLPSLTLSARNAWEAFLTLSSSSMACCCCPLAAPPPALPPAAAADPCCCCWSLPTGTCAPPHNTRNRQLCILAMALFVSALPSLTCARQPSSRSTARARRDTSTDDAEAPSAITTDDDTQPSAFAIHRC